jgi:hypothetical protein
MTDYSNILDGITQDELAQTGSGNGDGRSYDLAHIEVNEDGDVRLNIRTYFGGDGTPESIWNGRTLQYTLASNPDRNSLAADLAEGGRIANLLDRIIAGHSVDWDGNNMRGKLDEDAAEAAEELRDYVEDYEQSDMTTWQAAEWVYGSNSAPDVLRHLGLGVDATDDEIAEAAKICESEAESERIVLNGNVEDVLRECIERVREDQTESEDA